MKTEIHSLTKWKSSFITKDKRKPAEQKQLARFQIEWIWLWHSNQLRSSLSSSETRFISFSWLFRSALLNDHTLLKRYSKYCINYLFLSPSNSTRWRSVVKIFTNSSWSSSSLPSSSKILNISFTFIWFRWTFYERKRFHGIMSDSKPFLS